MIIDQIQSDNLPSWGTRFLIERQKLLDEHERITERLRLARMADDREAIADAEQEHLNIYGACAIHRAEAVNGFLASLRMAIEDDPGTVSHHLDEIIRRIVREELLPVAETVARLEARR